VAADPDKPDASLSDETARETISGAQQTGYLSDGQ
jgi:hypothetical protein